MSGVSIKADLVGFDLPVKMQYAVILQMKIKKASQAVRTRSQNTQLEISFTQVTEAFLNLTCHFFSVLHLLS